MTNNTDMQAARIILAGHHPIMHKVAYPRTWRRKTTGGYARQARQDYANRAGRHETTGLALYVPAAPASTIEDLRAHFLGDLMFDAETRAYIIANRKEA